MCNKERLVAYLYEDLNAIERSDFEAHLAGCPACRTELGELRHTRDHLAAWAPPEPEINFQIVRGTPPAPARRFGLVPQWALAAAAAIVLLAGAAALANIEVRYGSDGSLVVRSGWTANPADAVPAEPAPGADGSSARQAASLPAASEESEQLKAAVAALTLRVRELEQARPAVLRASAGPASGVSVSELRRILAESEARQRTELALQVTQVLQDVNAARVSDFARVQEVVGRAQGLTNYQLKQHRDSIESLSYRMAGAQPK